MTYALRNAALTTPEAWAGSWVRTRSGPRQQGHPPMVDCSTWHRVRDVDGWEGRIRTTCGYGPRGGFGWPAGGLRLEIARPDEYGILPGAICPRCKAWPASADPNRRYQEGELVLEDVLIDGDAVDRRLAGVSRGTA